MEQYEQIDELEAELAYLFEGDFSLSSKHERIESAHNMLRLDYASGAGYVSDILREYIEFCRQHRDKIEQLHSLYITYPYYMAQQMLTPDCCKKQLSYLISDDMTKEQKLKALGDAHWSANNSGYCDAMANRLMAGQSNSQTDVWERNCKNKDAIDFMYDWIKDNEPD